MADIVQNTTIQEDAKDLLLSQLKGKERVEAFLSALLAPAQTIENDIFEIRRQQKLNEAELDMLDKWGERVGISRQGRSDVEYLIQIKAKIAINVSRGTIEDVVRVFNLLTGATHSEVFERFPREVSLFCNADLSSDETLVTPFFGYSGATGAAGYGAGHYATTSYAVDAAYLYAIMDKVLSAGYRIGTLSYVPEVAAFGYSGSSSARGYGVGAYSTSI